VFTLADGGAPDAAREALERMRDAGAGEDTVYERILLGLADARLHDDAEAGAEGLELALEHRVLLYGAPIRLELGRLGLDVEENLVACHELARSVGAVDLVTRTEAEMRRQGVRVPSRRRRDPYALTDAEQRVAALVVEGLTNRAIAERLSYSVKTIEAYLSRIYVKTGCGNRVELARHMAGQP
jgi:DNA-binding CsgD family transcriptional regulator